MAELETIISAVCRGLSEGGVSAVISQNPFGGKKRHTSPIVTVGLKSGNAVSCGFAEYLGMRYDAENDTYNELYGKKLDIALGLTLWSPKSESFGHEKCLMLFSQVADALHSLPESLKVRELSCGETEYDTAAEMFRCDAELKLSAFLVAESSDESQFLDFKLKGVLIN
ncbi:MAG: hypothetical protein E7456_01525 [Ruminococcaceae bacterium]|nr:hypothetical protein [Oscillospiraceae bacterium]